MRRNKALCLLLAAALSLTAACGKEDYEVEYGVGGYIYSARRLSAPDGINDLKIAGDYMYFTRENENTVKRISITSLQSGEEAPNLFLSENILDGKVNAGEILEGVQNGNIVFPQGEIGSVQWNEINGAATLDDYYIDKEQNLYYSLQLFSGPYTAREAAGGLLCKQDGNGESIYKIYMPELRGLAADSQGRAYALSGEEIIVFDFEGRRLGAIPVPEYQGGNVSLAGELFGDSQGRVYYCSVSGLYARKGYEVIDDGSFKLRETGMFSGGSYEGHYEGIEGKRLLYTQSGNMVYEYDREKDEISAKLCLTDSGMKGFYVQCMVQVTEEHILMVYGEAGDRGLYLLSRIPVEELSEKEHIVIASLTPGIALREAAASFNQMNPQYHITIEGYGADYSETEGKWVYPMLDACLVSSNPPDIVDLSGLNICKYAAQGILDDLYPYLEESGSLSKEDFLENVLQGMTIDGKLVCIPAYFRLESVAGRRCETENMRSWTMEEVYGLQKDTDGAELLNDGYGQGWTMEYLLGKFCAPYYLETFVDWENRVCTFDSEEFGRLLAWAGKCAWRPEKEMNTIGDIIVSFQYVPEEAMLIAGDMNFVSQIYMEAQCGEEVVWLGMPVSDGVGRVSVEVYDAMAITAGSSHKEGAWAFLEYYLSERRDNYGFPTKKAEIRELYEEAVTPEYAGGILGENDEREMVVDYYMSIGGDRIPYYATPCEYADKVISAIESADFTPLTEEEESIIQIVTEEAESYCIDGRSLEEVTKVIQNRVQLLLNER